MDSNLLNPQNPEFISKIIQSTVIMAGAVVIFFGLKRVFQYLLQRAHLTTLAFGPVRLLLRYTALFAAAAMVLNVWGIRTDSVLAVLGTVVSLVAIGFVALWSVLSNVLCTFVLIMFKPFSVGDNIEVPSESINGRVVDLTLVFTTLRGGDGEFIQVPNNMFFQKIFKRHPGQNAVPLEHQLAQEKPAD